MGAAKPDACRAIIETTRIDWCGLHQAYFNAGELELLVALANSIEARSMLEIGCRDGRTARVMLANVPTLERYQGVDVLPDYKPALAHQKSEIPAMAGQYVRDDPRCKIIVHPRGSLDIGYDELQPCDFAFIDGDHSEQVVLWDSLLVRPVVRPGGLIVWHDFFNGAVEVTKVIKSLAACGWPICSIDGTWLAYMQT